MPKAATTSSIVLPRFDIRIMEIKLIGDSPLICHAWSEKAKKEMLDKQMKKAKSAKAARDPEKDFLDSLYPFPGGGYGFPIVAFKSAAVDACSYVEGITKVEARGAFHIGEGVRRIGTRAGSKDEFADAFVSSELVKIISDDPTPREDMVRVGMGTADIRFRGQFEYWSAVIPIRFNAGVLSAEQIIHLFDIAGFSVGVGEWRCQKEGRYGAFHVAKGGE